MPTELDLLFEKNINRLAGSLDKVLQSAQDEYKRLRKAGQKGELTHIYISFLLSGVLCKLPWLRVDLCDENERSDMTECSFVWDVQSISDKLYRDADMLKKQNDMIKDFESEQAWLDASDNYFRGFEKHLPQILRQCPTVKAVDCRWHFGQFFGKTAVVREKNKDDVL